MTIPQLNKSEVSRLVDHTILKADATVHDIHKLCDEAREHSFFAICVNACHVAECAKRLNGSSVKIATVVGFPLGADTTTTKVAATQEAIQNGAHEIDMVINIGALKSGDTDFVFSDIAAVAKSCGQNALLKVIIETALLTDSEKKLVCELSVKAGAHFVKTSTGFSTSGATAADVTLMRKTVGPNIGVKASGGIRTYAQFCEMVAAGASRVGCSASVAIFKDAL